MNDKDFIIITGILIVSAAFFCVAVLIAIKNCDEKGFIPGFFCCFFYFCSKPLYLFIYNFVKALLTGGAE